MPQLMPSPPVWLASHLHLCGCLPGPLLRKYYWSPLLQMSWWMCFLQLPPTLLDLQPKLLLVCRCLCANLSHFPSHHLRESESLMWHQLRMHSRIFCIKPYQVMRQRLSRRLFQKQYGANMWCLPERMQHLHEFHILHYLQQWSSHLVPVRMLHILLSSEKVLCRVWMCGPMSRRHFPEPDELSSLQLSLQGLFSAALELHYVRRWALLVEQPLRWEMSFELKTYQWKRFADLQELWYC